MHKSNYDYREEIYKNCLPKNSSSGLYLVSKIRNSFVHGSQQLPNPDDWVNDIRNDIFIITVSSRMVLLTMQMLLIAHFFKKQVTLEHLSMFDELFDIDSISLTSLLNVIHLQNYEALLP